jgi:hypothetical protein
MVAQYTGYEFEHYLNIIYLMCGEYTKSKKYFAKFASFFANKPDSKFGLVAKLLQSPKPKKKQKIIKKISGVAAQCVKNCKIFHILAKFFTFFQKNTQNFFREKHS